MVKADIKPFAPFGPDEFGLPLRQSSADGPLNWTVKINKEGVSKVRTKDGDISQGLLNDIAAYALTWRDESSERPHAPLKSYPEQLASFGLPVETSGLPAD